MPFDGLVTQGCLQMIIAVAIIPLPCGKIAQSEIQGRNPEFRHFRLSEIPEQQFATAYRELLKIQ